jgi:hypothetical protein
MRLILTCERERSVGKLVRIAIAVESDQRRWVAYGASDTPESETLATVRDIVGGHPVTLWLELHMPEDHPATVPANIALHSRKYDC